MWQMQAFYDVAFAFIWHYAIDAERFGWQPAHLLKPTGLAERWMHVGCPSEIAFERLGMLVLMGEDVYGYQACPDGSVALLRGDDFTAMQARHMAKLETWGVLARGDLPAGEIERPMKAKVRR